MAIFIIVNAVLLVLVADSGSDGAFIVLLIYWIFALARATCKWANPDHARRWKRLEEALLQSPTNELMDETLEFAKKKKMFAEDIYQVALKLIEQSPQNSRKCFALEVGRIKYKFDLIIGSEEQEIRNDIDARC